MKALNLFLVVAILALNRLVNATVTGSTVCNQYMCVLGKHDDTSNTDTYTLSPPSGTSIPLSQFGWIAIGFGTTMANTPMVIAWPNSDGSFTLSQRQAPSEVEPTVVNNPPRKATLLTSSSFSNTSSTAITFSLPASSSSTTSLNSTNLIWAYSPKNPGSSSDSVTLAQHSASGDMTLALLAPISSNSPTIVNGDSSSSNSNSNGLLIAHVVCGALATMLFIPVGVLIPRLARGFTGSRWWFPLHSSVQGFIAFGLVVSAFGIARHIAIGGITLDSHRKLGLTLFILMIFQVLLGIFTHYYKSPPNRFQTSSGRGPSNFSHMILGIVILAIGWWTTWEGEWWDGDTVFPGKLTTIKVETYQDPPIGIDKEWPAYSGKGVPSVGWKVGWGLVVGIVSITYILGLIFLLPRQMRREKDNLNSRMGSRNTTGSKLPLTTSFEMGQSR